MVFGKGFKREKSPTPGDLLFHLAAEKGVSHEQTRSFVLIGLDEGEKNGGRSHRRTQEVTGGRQGQWRRITLHYQLQIVVAIARRRESFGVMTPHHRHHFLQMPVIIFGQHLLLILLVYYSDVIDEGREHRHQRRDVIVNNRIVRVVVLERLGPILRYVFRRKQDFAPDVDS